MGFLNIHKPHVAIYVCASLLGISVLSCSKTDLPKFISDEFQNQTSSKIPKEETRIAQQELEKKIEATNKSINLLNAKLAQANSKLNNKNNDEIKFLKKEISEKKLKVSELNKKLNDSHQQNISKKSKRQNIQQQFQKRTELLQQKENEIHAKYESFTNQTNRFKSYQEEVNKGFLKRKQSLDQREKRLEEREKVLDGNINNRGSIKKEIRPKKLAKKTKANTTFQSIPTRKTLFATLPVNNYERYNNEIVLDRENELFWSRLNFHQKEGSYPEVRRECLEWADQMKREKYGGINRWRVPTHRELSQLHYLYQYVLGGDSENFKYWGVESKGTSNLTIFEYRNLNFQNNVPSQVIANCRVVANINRR